jgi:hypothetical protein
MSHSVTLTWVAPTTGTVVSYDVQRALVTGGTVGAYASIASPEPTTTTYTDVGPFVEGDTYSYQVCSVNSAGESSPCPSVTALIPFSVPGAPTGLVVSKIT